MYVCVYIYIYIYIYIDIHVSDYVQPVYELALLSNNTTSETFLHKSVAVRRVDWIFYHCGTGGDWSNT